MLSQGRPMVELPSSYLKCRVELADVDRRLDFANADCRADWERLLAKKRPGDELWEFAPQEGAVPLQGIALVRKGKIISTFIEAVG